MHDNGARKEEGPKDLFQKDRRAVVREDGSDRRQFLRPTSELQRRGFWIALVAIVVLATAIYLISRIF